MTVALLVARCALAVVFAIAGFAKLADRATVRSTLAGFGVSARPAQFASLALPLAELAIAALVLVTPTAQAAAIAALALLAIFCATIVRTLARGERPDCNCFGRARSAPIGPTTLTRNATLAVIAGAVAIGGPGEGLGAALAGADVPAWGMVLAAGLAIEAWFGWHLLRQQGRLIERIGAVEDAARALRAPHPIAGREPAHPAPVVERLEVHRRGHPRVGA